MKASFPSEKKGIVYSPKTAQVLWSLFRAAHKLINYLGKKAKNIFNEGIPVTFFSGKVFSTTFDLPGNDFTFSIQ